MQLVITAELELGIDGLRVQQIGHVKATLLPPPTSSVVRIRNGTCYDSLEASSWKELALLA